MQKLIDAWNEDIKKVMKKNRLRLLYQMDASVLNKLVSIEMIDANNYYMIIKVGENRIKVNRTDCWAFWSVFCRENNIEPETIQEVSSSILFFSFYNQHLMKNNKKCFALSSLLDVPITSLVPIDEEMIDVYKKSRYYVVDESEREGLFKSCVLSNIDNIWICTAFLSKLTGLDKYLIESIADSLGNSRDELKRDSLLNLLKGTCGEEVFFNEIKKQDGYVRWLNSVDHSTELKKDGFYIYQIN